jgi:hypothetical protein
MGKNKPANKIVNFNRSNLKTPSNKIVPTGDSLTTEKSLDRKIENTQKKIDKIQKKIIQNEVKAANLIDEMRDNIQEGRDAVRDERKKFPKNLLKNRLDLKSKFKKSPPTIRWTPSDDPLDRKIGWGKTTYGRGILSPIDKLLAAEERAKARIQKYKAGLQKSSRLRAPNIPKSSALKAGLTSKLSGLGSGIGTLGAGIVLNALSDKYLSPLADKAGTKLGESVLVPAGRKIDQLLIRKKKKDD